MSTRTRPARTWIRVLTGLAAALVFLVCCIAFAIPWAKEIYLEHRLFPAKISYELSDAPLAPTRAGRVGAWLTRNRQPITDAARRFGITRDAIAGLIAYEALVDVHLARYAGLADWSGPGKVHFKQYRFAEGHPLAQEVEDDGMLPRRTMGERERILQTPKWAALYIAASMRLLANIVREQTHHDLSCDAGALVTLDSAWDSASVGRYFKTHDQQAFVFTDNFAGSWVAGETAFLEKSVGAPVGCTHRH